MNSIPILALTALLTASCTTLPRETNQTTRWQQQHEEFRQSENWKKLSYVNNEVVNALTPETTSIHISRTEQRGLLLYADDIVAIDFPVSTGRKGYPTPAGKFNVLSKKDQHRSNLYGNFVDIESGQILARDVSNKNDPKPEGAAFQGASMPKWIRLTNSGIGLHIGVVPGYPASHGCIRVPSAIMPQIYAKTAINTPVVIE